jgi:hypothetical protein
LHESCEDDFECGSSFGFVEEVDFISHDEGDFFHPFGSVPEQRVGFFVGGDYDVVALEPWVCLVVVACADADCDAFAVFFPEGSVFFEFVVFLVGECS